MPRLQPQTPSSAYGPYLDRLDIPAGAQGTPSDNREELSRAEAALSRAAAGQNVAVVSGGDPGVFAMAAGHLRSHRTRPGRMAGRSIIETVPGVTAMLAVCGASRCAARA